MTTLEFIEWLDDLQTEREKGFLPYFSRTYQNCDDFWTLYRPFVDCINDSLVLTEDCVIYSYNHPDSKEKKYTYEEFVRTNINDLGDDD